jgi:hypothetical protein
VVDKISGWLYIWINSRLVWNPEVEIESVSESSEGWSGRDKSHPSREKGGRGAGGPVGGPFVAEADLTLSSTMSVSPGSAMDRFG